MDKLEESITRRRRKVKRSSRGEWRQWSRGRIENVAGVVCTQYMDRGRETPQCFATETRALNPKVPLSSKGKCPLQTLVAHADSVMAKTWRQEENNVHHLWLRSMIFLVLSFFCCCTLYLCIHSLFLELQGLYIFKMHC